MNKEDKAKLARDCVPGIYNYCDRWCERCTMTSRCLSWALEKECKDNRRQELDSAVFWDNLSEVFAVTIELLREVGEELGVDLSEVADETELGISVSPPGETVVYLAVHLAQRYAERTEIFFAVHPLKAITEKPLWPRLAGSSEHLAAVAVGDALAVIRWYQHFIGLKLRRALASRDSLDDDGCPEDENGSAKIALLAIDRSISAWGVLLGSFPEQKKKIMNFILLLQKLLHKAEAEFPSARAFARPGFDDGQDRSDT
jgi:hypothetical protein